MTGAIWASRTWTARKAKRMSSWGPGSCRIFGRRWEEFTRHHSRFHSRRDGARPSRLCYADKLALCYEWEWFYLFRTRITGELREYMALSANGKYSCKEYMNRSIETPQSWYRAVKSFTLRYVAQNYRYGHR